MIIGFGLARKLIAITAPKKIPATKKRFQISFFHSYLKNGILAGTQAAQICRRDELMPNDLLPKINNVGTVNPIKGPATYHGHGCLINSIKLIFSKILYSFFTTKPG